jgi:PAS domain S-box-containing protein
MKDFGIYRKTVALSHIRGSFKVLSSRKTISNEDLIEIVELGEDFAEVFVLNSHGKITYSSDVSKIGLSRLSDLYFLNAAKGLYIKPLYRSETIGDASFTISTLYNGGVLVARMKLNHIQDIFSNKEGLGETGESLLAYRDENGDAVFFTDRRFKTEVESRDIIPKEDVNIPMTQALLGNEKEFSSYVDYRGVSVFAVTKYVEGIDVGLVVKIDKEEILTSVSKNTNLIWRSTFQVIFAIIITGIIFYFLLTYSLRREIERKTSALKKASEGLGLKVVQLQSSDKRLRASEEKFRYLYENAPYGLVVCQLIKDENGKGIDFMHLQANKATERQCGFRPEDIEGKKASEVGSQEETAAAIKLYEQVVSTGKPIKYTQYFSVYDRTLEVTAFQLSGDIFIINFFDVTDRKDAEMKLSERSLALQNMLEDLTESREDLEENKNRLDLALKGAKAGLWDWNVETGYVFFDKMWCGMLGYRQDEIEPNIDAWEKMIHPDDKSRSSEVLNKHFENNENEYKVELRLKCKNGEWKWVLSSGKIFERDEDEKPLRMVGTHSDISERKRSEEKLRESETRLRELYENMASGVAMYDAIEDGENFVFKGINRSGEKMSNVKKEDIIGKKVTEVFPKVKEFGLFKVLQNVWKTGKSQGHPLSLYKDERLESWYENYVYRLPSGEVIAIYDDVTQRMKAEEEVRELSKFPSENPNPVLRVTKDGKLLYANEAAVVLTESKKCFGEEGKVVQAWKEEIDKALDTKKGVVFEVEWHEKYYSFTVAPVLDAAYINLYGRDVTERRKAENKLEKYKVHLEELVEVRTRELEGANKELETFSYSVAHDLRAPLRSMDGFSRILLDTCKDKLDDDSKDNLDRIRKASQRMAQLIDDILVLSRVTRQEIKKERVDLSKMAELVLSDIRGSDPSRQKVEVVVQKGLFVEVDPNLMQLVFENLLGNAWKFTSKTGDVKIEFGKTTEEKENIFFVRDNGAGFDMAYVDKLFCAFQRLHSEKEFPGTGIGLVSVKRIISRHGGRVWADGEMGKGATFYFTI